MNKLLIVEDDRELNKLVCSYLQNANFVVETCFNGEEAYRLFNAENFDLIISDIMMPIMDGFSLVEKIRNKNNEVPIILMTARDDKFSKQLGYKLGIDDYIVKPFDIDELAFKVSAILRRTNFKKSEKVIVGNLCLDNVEHTAYVNDK